jgi:hypothetical protein
MTLLTNAQRTVTLIRKADPTEPSRLDDTQVYYLEVADGGETRSRRVRCSMEDEVWTASQDLRPTDDDALSFYAERVIGIDLGAPETATFHLFMQRYSEWEEHLRERRPPKG